MVDSVSLSPLTRENLNVLRTVNSQLDRTNQRLATGIRTHSLRDGAGNFFRLPPYRDQRDDYSQLSFRLDQGISAIEAHLNAFETLKKDFGVIRSLFAQAREIENPENRRNLDADLIKFGNTLVPFLRSVSYNGLSLLDEANSVLRITIGDSSASEAVTVSSSELLSRIDLDRGGVLEHDLFDADGNFNPYNITVQIGGVDTAFTGFSDINPIDGTPQIPLDPETDTDTYNALEEYFGAIIERIETRATQFGRHVSVLSVLRDDSRTVAQRDLGDVIAALETADEQRESANALALRLRNQVATQSLAQDVELQRSLLSLLA